jgi:hypothetical protein
MAVEPSWRPVELCEMPLRNGASAVAKVERDDLGVCYWRLQKAIASGSFPVEPHRRWKWRRHSPGLQ